MGSGEFCFLGLYPVNSSALTFGDSFLRNYFIAFDKVNNKIAYSTFIFNLLLFILFSPNKPNWIIINLLFLKLNKFQIFLNKTILYIYNKKIKLFLNYLIKKYFKFKKKINKFFCRLLVIQIIEF